MNLLLCMVMLLWGGWAFAQSPEPMDAEPVKKREQLLVERFGTLFLDARNNVKATDILARWREYTIRAESVEGNLDKGEYQFQGKVGMEGGGLNASGELLRLNVRQRLWQLERASADIAPEFVQSQLTGSLRLSGMQLQGEEQRAHLQHGDVTTCLREHPHYHFAADKVDILVDKRMIARNVSLSALGRRLFSLPTVVVPLDRRLSRGTLPQVGQSVEEGYYVKTALGYLLGDNAGTARIDLMQKKGVGLGIDQQYLWKGATGLLSLYYLNDRNRAAQSTNAQFQHRQKLLGFDVRLTGDLRSASYLYYSDTRAASWQVNLNRALSDGNLSILSRVAQQSSAGYSSDSTVSTLRWNQRWGTQTSLNLSADLSRFRSLSGGEVVSRQEQLTTQLMMSGQNSRFDWTLGFNRIVPLGERTGGFLFGGLEKTPELLVSTTDRRLWNRDLGLQMHLGVGSFRELPKGKLIQRLLFETRWNPRATTESGVNASVLFRQVFTSDGTAQYVLQTNAEWQHRFGEKSRWTVNYRYLRPYGFTPLRTEYMGSNNFASAGLDWTASPSLSLRVYTGYDLFAKQRGSRPWQPLNMGILWQPHRDWQLNVQSTLNLNEGQWNYLRAYLRAQSPAFAMNLSGVYDPVRQRWANASLWLNTQLFHSLWRIQTYVVYNGYVGRFEGRQLLLTADLHCWELSVGYIDNPLGFRSDRELVFQLRIKAFPMQQRFGVGQFGQALESGGGWMY